MNTNLTASIKEFLKKDTQEAKNYKKLIQSLKAQKKQEKVSHTSPWAFAHDKKIPIPEINDRQEVRVLHFTYSILRGKSPDQIEKSISDNKRTHKLFYGLGFVPASLQQFFSYKSYLEFLLQYKMFEGEQNIKYIQKYISVLEQLNIENLKTTEEKEAFYKGIKE